MAFKHPLLIASLSGLAAIGLVYSYNLIQVEGDTVKMLKKNTLAHVLESLKQELKKFPIDPPRDDEDGILSKDFMLKMHSILYRYKKYGSEMLAQANF